jgi:carbon monoxide dehydrogenase subunit G
MRAYRFTIHVDRPSQVVWDYLTDLEQGPRWRTGFKHMEVQGGGPLRAGARLVLTVEFMGKTTIRTSDVMEFDPPNRWVTGNVNKAQGLSGEFVYEVAPDGAGARLTTACELHAHRFLSWIFLPLIARAERKRRVGQLERFKAACEAASK